MNTVPDEPVPDGDEPERLAEPVPEQAPDQGAWEVIHSTFAASPSSYAARVRMRTSDGLFRITAARVDGKLGVTVERLAPTALTFIQGGAGDRTPQEPSEKSAEEFGENEAA